MELRPIGTVFAYLAFNPLREDLRVSQYLDGLRHSLHSYAPRVSTIIVQPHPGSDTYSHTRLPAGYAIRFICSTTSSTEARDTCRVVCRSCEFSTSYNICLGNARAVPPRLRDKYVSCSDAFLYTSMIAFDAPSVRWKLGLTMFYMLQKVNRLLRVLRHCLRFVGESSGGVLKELYQ